MSGPSKQPQAPVFQVYLRLRPPLSQQDAQRGERFLTAESPSPLQNASTDKPAATASTHVTLQPPSDNKKRAVEKFAFTKVFEETSSQLELFQDAGMEPLIRGVLLEGRDSLVATLGVTGSGKVRKAPTFNNGRNVGTLANQYTPVNIEPHDSRN